MKWADWETITVQGRDFAVMVEPDDRGGYVVVEGWGSNQPGSVRERWYWAVLIVAPLIADDTPDPDNYDVLGGCESFAWEEIARTMAEDMIAAERREATERAAALSMGIPTVGVS